MSTKQAVVNLLLHHGHRSFCIRCLARAVKAHTVPPRERAMKDLGATRGYRVKEGECSNGALMTMTNRALWTGM
jgi:hypothetical protein